MSQALQHCYLFFGNQDLLVQEAAEKCINEVLEGREREWSYERYDLNDMLSEQGDTASQLLQDFLLSCETPPMFSDRKVFRLDHAELLKSPKEQAQDHPAARIMEALRRSLSSPSANLFWVFSSPVLREKDSSKNLLTLIQQNGQVRKFVAYDDQSQLGWLQKRSREKRINLNPDAAKSLIEIVGNDLNDLEQELDKLKAGMADEHEISAELVRHSVLGHKHVSVFRMIEALANKKLKEALEVLDQQLSSSPRDHVRLFSLIIFQFRRLLTLHYLLQRNVPESEVAGKVGLPPFLARQALKQANHYTCAELESIMLHLAGLDLDIKFQGSLSRMMLVNLFQQICNGSFSTAQSWMGSPDSG